MNCRFTFAGQVRYGQDEPYSEEAKKYAAQGKLVVSDAVTGQLFAIDKKDFVKIPFGEFPEYLQDEEIYWNGSEADDFVALASLAHDLQEARVRKALKGKKKVMPGHQFRIGVADGYACYVVTKIRGKKALVEWRASPCADHYHDHHFGFGGVFPMADLSRYIMFEPIFGKPRTIEDMQATLVKYAADFQRRFGRNPLPMLMNYLIPA